MHKEYARRRPEFLRGQPAYRAAAMLLTFWWVCLAWIFFRAQDLGGALGIAEGFVTWHGQGTEDIAAVAAVAILGLGLLHALEARRLLSGALLSLGEPAFYALAGTATAVALALTPIAYRPFIYFQF